MMECWGFNMEISLFTDKKFLSNCTVIRNILIFILILNFFKLFSSTTYPIIINNTESDTIDLAVDSLFINDNEKLLATLQQEVFLLQKYYADRDSGYITFLIKIDKFGYVIKYDTQINALENSEYEERLSKVIKSWKLKNKARQEFTIIHSIDLSINLDDIDPRASAVRNEMRKTLIVILIVIVPVISMIIIPVIRANKG